MGTRRRKRMTRKTRKKGGVWTPNKNLTVNRRQELLTYTSNSTQKSNNARKAFHNYLEAIQQQKNISNEDIARDDVLDAITPDRSMIDIQQGSLTDYLTYAKRRCSELVETKIRESISQKKSINQKHRLSQQAAFLANRAAMRAQQAAHIASIGRLSNSSVDATVQAELDAWNRRANQRKSEQKENKTKAQLILQNKSSIQTEVNRLRYEFTKQVAEHIQGLDYIIPLYESRNQKTTMQEIVKSARINILAKIPAFKGKDAMYIDRVIPMITEEIYGTLLATLEEYIVSGGLNALEILHARLQFFIIKETQMRLAQQHFEIISEAHTNLRKILAENVLLNKQLYKHIVSEITKISEQIKSRERGL